MRLPPRVGNYEILRELGRGGMGVVLLARAPDGREVAIKVLLDPSKGSAFERFDRERRLLASLGEDAGFVPLLDAGSSPQGPFVVMPFLPGGTLRAALEAGALPVDDAVAIGTEIARALGHAHERGIVHRDMKPDNVLFDSAGRALVSDLGLAKHFRSDVSGASQSTALTKTGEMRGTASYMAPEQTIDSKNVGPAADVFALGAILYECLSGSPAFSGDSSFAVIAHVQAAEFEPLRRVAPQVPRWLAAVVDRALSREPAKRYADGAALARALEARDAGRNPTRGIALAALVGVVLGGAGLGVFLSARGSQPRVVDPKAAPAPPEPAPAPPAPPAPPPAAPSPEAERAAKLAASGDRAGALDAWEKALRAEKGPGRAEVARSTWLAAASVAEDELEKRGPVAALEPLRRVRAIASEEPPEVGATRARIELTGLLAKPGRARSDSDSEHLEKKVRLLLLKWRGIARGRAAFAPELTELGLWRLMRVAAVDTAKSGVETTLAEARVHLLAAQDAVPGRHVPELYTSYVSRWTMFTPIRNPDVFVAGRAYGACSRLLEERAGGSDYLKARGLAVRSRKRQLDARRRGDAPAEATARSEAEQALTLLQALLPRAADLEDDPAFLDALARVHAVLGQTDRALVYSERAGASVASWDTLVESSRHHVERGELELALEDADVAVRALEYESLVPGLDARAQVAARQRCLVAAYRQRAAVKRLQGTKDEAERDEKALAEAALKADRLGLPQLESE